MALLASATSSGSLAVNTSGLMGTSGNWTQSPGTLVLTAADGGTCAQGAACTVTFDLQHAAAEYTPPTVRISAAVNTGSTALGSIAEADMVAPNTPLMGVVNGANPLVVVLPEFFDCAAGKYTAACQDDLSWRSSTGASCLDYTSNMWCAEGTYGPDWRFGTFADWGTDGIDASHACCECGSKWKFSTTEGATAVHTCLDCAAGKFSTTEGATAVDTCLDCAAGKFSTTEGASAIDTCLDCAAGKFSAAAGAGACDDCAAGKFSTTEGATAVDTCSACTAGKYSAGATGAVACVFTPPSPDTCYGAAVMIDLLNARYPFCVHM